MLALRTRLSHGAAVPPADPKRRAALVAPGPRMSHGYRALASLCPGRRARGGPHRIRGGPHARRPRAAACHSSSAPNGAEPRTAAPSDDELLADQAVINGEAPSATTDSGVLARWLTPPAGLLARTRWLFLLAALIATGILGPLLVVIGT